MLSTSKRLLAPRTVDLSFNRDRISVEALFGYIIAVESFTPCQHNKQLSTCVWLAACKLPKVQIQSTNTACDSVQKTLYVAAPQYFLIESQRVLDAAASIFCENDLVDAEQAAHNAFHGRWIAAAFLMTMSKKDIGPAQRLHESPRSPYGQPQAATTYFMTAP